MHHILNQRAQMAKQGKAPEAPAFESDLRLEHTASIIERRVKAGKKLPLEVMLDVMDLYYEQNNHAAAGAMADRAAPYVHPKLKDLIITGGGVGAAPIRFETNKGMSKLSDKELQVFEKLLQKIGDS